MFQFDAQWDVDKAAESLNTSLFGKPKKQKFSGTPSLALLDKSYTSAIPDSDDEQYTKKDKKKMKKWRNKNKVHNKTSEIDSTELNEGKDTDGKKTGAKKSVKKGGTTTEDSGQKKKIISPVKKKLDIANAKSQKVKKESKHQEPNLNTPSHEKVMEIISPVKKKSDIANAKSQKVKKESKHQEPNLNTPSHENLMEKKSKKRKRSLSQSADDVVGSKNKMAKAEEHKNSTVANGDVAESGEGKKKRKRNRKKKNNSKKNKYKHLALNSKSKPENSDIPHDGVLLSPVLEPTKNKSTLHSQKPISAKSLEYIHKNTDISSVVSLSDSAVLVHKQSTNKDNHTGSLTLDSQIQNKSKKRKKVRDSDLAPTKKLKQGKNNSRDETPIPSSDIPLAPKTSNSSEQTSAQLSISLKNKKKQQVLLKLLNQTQIQKQESPNVNNKKDSASGKKKSKMLLEHGSANNNINSTQHENQQESISENVHKKPIVNASPESHSIWGKAAELGQQAKEKLDSARFRYINEQLYSCTGGDALKLFREDRTAFSVYHEGFQNQVNKWPVNPLDIFIKQIKDKPKNLVIADFGCGDAKLAQSVPQKVHSFDLVALNNRITVCDMSKTPLPGEKVDIAVFCLSLMGTNITDYVLEANRVLKTGGLLKIAEVVSRFSGLSRFVEGVCNCGFQLLNKRDTDQMFYLFDFKKIKPVKKSAAVGEIKLKPCIYKRR